MHSLHQNTAHHASTVTALDPDTLPGLPGRLPEGEHVLWQGSPRWTALARRSLHGSLIAVYFGLLALWRLGEGLAGGESAAAAAGSALFIASLGAAVLAIIAAYAWLAARTTFYTVTTRRVVLTFGIALPVTLNLPFKVIGAADVKLFADGTGDIPLKVTEKKRLSFVVLWPHVRPWRLGRVQPMLRAVPDAATAANLLGDAWAAGQGPARSAESAPVTPPVPLGVPASEPATAGLQPVAA